MCWIGPLLGALVPLEDQQANHKRRSGTLKHRKLGSIAAQHWQRSQAVDQHQPYGRHNEGSRSWHQCLQDRPGQILDSIKRHLQHLATKHLHHLVQPRSRALFAALQLGPISIGKSSKQDSGRHHADLKQLFDRIDTDGNGQLDSNELQVGVKSLEGTHIQKHVRKSCACLRCRHKYSLITRSLPDAGQCWLQTLFCPAGRFFVHVFAGPWQLSWKAQATSQAYA